MANAKLPAALKVALFIIFLDMAGFSILFPLFPAIMRFYFEGESSVAVHGVVHFMASLAGRADVGMAESALFGGFLGFVFSFAQFLAAPVFGRWSDRHGRRKALLFSLGGLGFSYLVWAISGNFWVFLASRLAAGLLSGNISLVSAVVADLSDGETRMRNMAFMGMAFGMGFLVGPVLGGILGSIDLLHWFPSLASFGLHPFSVAAFSSLFFCLASAHMVFYHLPETLPPGGVHVERHWFPRLAHPIHATNFFFNFAFSGMEFAMGFYAMERLGYSPMNLGFLFLYIGIWVALVQGGISRRARGKEAPMAIVGLSLLIPGLMLIGATHSTWQLLLAMAVVSVGSGLTTPALSALASASGGVHNQGALMGDFRSAGSLGRTLGPLLAAAVYWRVSASAPFVAAGLLGAVPMFLLVKYLRTRR